MAGKISLKTTVFIFLFYGILIILSACITPVDMDEFFNDPDVQDIIDKINNPSPSKPEETVAVKIDDQTGDGLKGGKGKIEGLKDNKYYMIEKEVDADGAVAEGYPKYVTEYPTLTPGQLIDDLAVITRIKGGSINHPFNLNNTYTVRAAAPFFDGLIFTYSDTDSAGAKNQTVSVINGAITIPAPKGKVNLEKLDAFDGYEVMGVAVSTAALSAPPFSSHETKTISSGAGASFQLEGADTEVDYIFIKTGEKVNFYVLTVKIDATPKPATGSFNITLTITEGFSGITAVDGSNNPVTSISKAALFASNPSTSQVVIKLTNDSYTSVISWSISGTTFDASTNNGFLSTTGGLTNDTLTINNSSIFWGLLSGNSITINVTVNKGGATLSPTAPITIQLVE